MTTQPHQNVPEWTFGDRLRRVRRSMGLKQGQFAQLIEVQAKAYGQWESDINKPHVVIRVARKVEQVTGVPAAWLLGVDRPGPTAGPGLSLVAGAGFEPATSGLQVNSWGQWAA